MMSTWNGGRGFSAFMSRRKPGRLANSAPEIPSSTKMHAAGTVHPCARRRPCMGDLASNALRLVVDGVLIGGLAGVNRSDHCETPPGEAITGRVRALRPATSIKKG